MRRILRLARNALCLTGLALGLLWLQGQLDAPLAERALDLPARLYARPLAIVPGTRVSAAELRVHLAATGYREAKSGPLRRGEYRIAKRTWRVHRRGFAFPDGIDPGGLTTIRLDAAGLVKAVEGPDDQPLAAAFLEPESLGVLRGPTAQDRALVRLAELPPYVADAVIAVEDKRFFRHHGVDWRRVLGAARANVRERRVVQGGSTLTQQLAKNLHLSSERTWRRKLRELGVALLLELRNSKEEILEAYLNDVYLGQHRGVAIHGVERAAQIYFGRQAAELTLDQAALLAGMIRAPNRTHPVRHARKARHRRDVALRLMQEQGRITAADAERARKRPLAAKAEGPAAMIGGYFADHVGSRLREQLPERSLHADGLVVFTTLDGARQRAAEAAIRRELARIERERPKLTRGGRKLQAALVALDPQTGDVVAWVGGRDRRRSAFDRVAQARRQPGSVFKPLVAAAALDPRRNDHPLTLATILADEPLEVQAEDALWAPANLDRRFRGPVTLRHALEASLNVPFARLGMETGLVRVADTAKRFGISGPLRPVPSLSLGVFEVTPLEMTRAYAVFAAGGWLPDTRSVLAVTAPTGRLVGGETPRRKRVLPEATAYLVTSALRGAVERGTARALRKHGVAGPIAAKTGSTNGLRDAWLVAYTPDLVVGVWVGLDGGQPLGLTGAKAALPIAARFLRAESPAPARPFPAPPQLEVVEIDPHTGRRATWACPGYDEVFETGSAPRERCETFRSLARWRLFGP